jgi:hypothetical protein
MLNRIPFNFVHSADTNLQVTIWIYITDNETTLRLQIAKHSLKENTAARRQLLEIYTNLGSKALDLKDWK